MWCEESVSRLPPADSSSVLPLKNETQKTHYKKGQDSKNVGYYLDILTVSHSVMLCMSYIWGPTYTGELTHLLAWFSSVGQFTVNTVTNVLWLHIIYSHTQFKAINFY